MQKKIGLYSGVFDPIHNGHIAFAELALQQGRVDQVYFMVEPQPRRKQNVTSLEHRLAMVEAATKDKPKLNVLSIDQPTFSARQTLPLLQATFPGASLCLLMGSDLFGFVEAWSDYAQLRPAVSFGVARRRSDTVDESKLVPGDWLVDSPHPHVSSSQIRSSVAASQDVLPQDAINYLVQNKLYLRD
ncbi:adenylyltransferase/cytidyltransferase family protein [Candidatus Saccharibacteria bacterium]|nr:adenylyltransferase/cytidyltransferase family protein [Candidatus Saccharibacteria bacterium]